MKQGVNEGEQNETIPVILGITQVAVYHWKSSSSRRES